MSEVAIMILRAAKQKVEAEKAAAKAEGQRRREECEKLFAPVLEFWDGVKDLEVRDFQFHSQERVKFSKHVSSVDGTCIYFYGGGGGSELSIRAEYDQGRPCLKMRNHVCGRYLVPDAVCVTAEEAISAIARRGVQYDIDIA